MRRIQSTHLGDVALQLLEDVLELFHGQRGHSRLSQLTPLDVVHDDIRAFVDDEDILYPRNGYGGVLGDVFDVCRL